MRMTSTANRTRVIAVLLAGMLAASAVASAGCKRVAREPGEGQPHQGTPSESVDATLTPPASEETPKPTPEPSPETTPGTPSTDQSPTAEQPPAARRSLAPYAGLGAWIDIFDDAAFDDPEGTVDELASYGVKTIYIETGNSEYPRIYRIDRQRRFITAAHARDMYVVAWFLPWLINTNRDFNSVRAAINLRTKDGDKFDSFTLDIESTKVRNVASRSRRAISLSRRIRQLVGTDYALGGCIPSPVGMANNADFWRPFPYAALSRYYDVWVPMGYYTFHGNGARSALVDSAGNVRILRAQRGVRKLPVHLVGGLAEDSSAVEVRAFVRAARSQRVIGASLYDWATMNSAHWRELRPVRTLGRNVK